MESLHFDRHHAATVPPNRPFMALKRLARPVQAAERCELCGLELTAEHEHLFDPATRRLACACTACALLFEGELAGKFRRVPRRVRRLPNFHLSNAEWDGLFIPINMAFFFHSTPAAKIVAMYPSPAGPTESMLELAAWNGIVEQNPVLSTMRADVEALLVKRLSRHGGTGSPEYYLLPIDQCYKLVGLLRTHWRGLSGGNEVWQAVDGFFRQLHERAESDA